MSRRQSYTSMGQTSSMSKRLSQLSKRVCGIDMPSINWQNRIGVNTDSEKAFYTAFGQMLSEMRRKKRISQEMLADELGLSRTSITNIEKGRQPVQLYSLYIIARLLGTDVKDLLPSAAIFERPERTKGLNVSRSEWLETMNVKLDPTGDDDANRRTTSSNPADRK
jgi:transcriptional regulator with XRE-family HTH domain